MVVSFHDSIWTTNVNGSIGASVLTFRRDPADADGIRQVSEE